MARTTRTGRPTSCSMSDVVTEAAAEITTASGANTSRTSRRKPFTCCGFRQMITSPAPATARAFAVCASMRYFVRKYSARGACATVARICRAGMSLEPTSPDRIASPSFPAPISAIGSVPSDDSARFREGVSKDLPSRLTASSSLITTSAVITEKTKSNVYDC